MDEALSFHVVIVGAGPAGLCAAIALKQKAAHAGHSINVCVLEKGSHLGAHNLSGAVLETEALSRLMPQWREDPAFPAFTPVENDEFLYLTQKKAISLPVPSVLQNEGNIIISLGQLCQWLGQKAQDLGVEIYPGFPASSLLMDQGQVVGVKTADQGRKKDGLPGDHFQPGMNIYAQSVFLAEGCRGQLSQEAIKTFSLANSPQTYGLGLKEIWRVRPEVHRPGQVIHTVGWPLTSDVYGGSFIYHTHDHTVTLGLVVGLDYSNPFLDPFGEFQRLKTHPYIKHLLTGGERLHYGARALNEGGWQSIPTLDFPGGCLVGCAAGFLNVAKIKGIQGAIESGIQAAHAFVDQKVLSQPQGLSYGARMGATPHVQGLYQVRNIRPGFRRGLLLGLAYSALDLYILKGRAPWTFSHRSDHMQFMRAEAAKPIAYPKPDGVLTFDKMSSVALTGTHHREDEPGHLKLKDPALAIGHNWALYGSPEQRYCPAGVYEILNPEENPQLVIHHTNCIHCKTCDLKDPCQNITWTTPEGGGGPQYMKM